MVLGCVASCRIGCCCGCCRSCRSCRSSCGRSVRRGGIGNSIDSGILRIRVLVPHLLHLIGLPVGVRHSLLDLLLVLPGLVGVHLVVGHGQRGEERGVVKSGGGRRVGGSVVGHVLGGVGGQAPWGWARASGSCGVCMAARRTPSSPGQFDF